MRARRFDHFFVVQLLQNIDDYIHVLNDEPFLYDNDTLKLYLKWNIDRLFLKWLEYFPI